MMIIGDVHGLTYEYKHLLTDEPSIQLGDFGFKEHHQWHLANVDSSLHKISFGNHDDYTFLNAPHSLGNFSYQNGIFSLRGANSIDFMYRTEGVDLFSNEQMNYSEMNKAFESYVSNKPEIVVSHECPLMVKKYLIRHAENTPTASGFQKMFEEHQPKIWIFGHYHQSFKMMVNATTFICLNELETLSI